MIYLIEDYLDTILRDGLEYLKNHIDRLDYIMKTPTGRTDRLKSFLLNTPVNITKGYPRTPAELPCFCILLSSENDTQETLGDYDNDQNWNIVEVEETLPVIAHEGGVLPPPSLDLPNKPLVSVESIKDDTGHIIEGYQYEVTDADKGLVAFYNSLSDGENVTVKYKYRKTSMDMVETMYESTYRIEVWAANADLVIDLYQVVKWVFLYNRDYLVTDLGLFRQKLSGADYEPAPSFFPDFVYRRAFTFWCQYSASIPFEEVPYISAVDTNQSISFDVKK